MANPEVDVKFYRANGLSFFPLPYGAKKDNTFKWGVYRTRHPSDDEITTWFGNGTRRNIAVVCGQVSGGKKDSRKRRKKRPVVYRYGGPSVAAVEQ